ncbi:MAG: ectoine hydroxylase-related dioxygenase (phytanoyl-CoA dioxygenase family) [Gammaproteobacteria bacterium]|jgi:ectoine hydroxylase-related dioxygenase (phytanoyl-CoA dioxygenase family)
MNSIPHEFDPATIKSKSAPEMQMYRTEVTSQEPMKSLLENNPEIYFVTPMRGSQWGAWEFKSGSYYDTTIGSKHPFWQDKDLPRPTKDLQQLRRDMLKWGYCKIENALSPEQVAVIHQRVLEQAEGERLAGVAQKTPSGQNINCCVNKGQCFEGFIEQHPSVVQGGALIEQLVTEALGAGWICTSLIAAISLKGGVPQALHQDQNNALDSRSPMAINILTPITDIGARNGGTLVIPGSHLALSEAVRENKPVGKLPPAINIDAKAGTMVITDGRLLHGTGVNHTDIPRIVMLNGMQKLFLRQQENWMLSVSPKVLKRASNKLLHRMGYQATTGTQTNEGHGFGATGLVGEAAGATVDFRLAADRGEYVRVGELGPNSTPEELQAAYTLRDVVGTARAGGKSAPVGIGGSRVNETS